MVDDPKRRYFDRHTPVERRGITIAAILSIIALIFSLGANYQKIIGVDDRVQTFVSAAERTYVRQDVSAAQYDSISYQLQQLRMQVDQLTNIVMEQERGRRPESNAAPRFR